MQGLRRLLGVILTDLDRTSGFETDSKFAQKILTPINFFYADIVMLIERFYGIMLLFGMGATMACDAQDESPLTRENDWFPAQLSIIRSSYKKNREQAPKSFVQIEYEQLSSWLRLRERGIAFNGKEPALHVDVALPEIDSSYAAGVTIFELPGDVVRALAKVLKDTGDTSPPFVSATGTYTEQVQQMAMVYADRYLLVVTSPPQFLAFNRKLANRINQYIVLPSN